MKMQKYTPLKGVNENIASPAAPPAISHLTNGYETDILDSNLNNDIDNTDNTTTSVAMNSVSSHYNNKSNMAKLQWWNAPPTRLTLDHSNSLILDQKADSPVLNKLTQEVREDDKIFSTNNYPKDSPNKRQMNQTHVDLSQQEDHQHQHQYQHHYHNHHHHHHHADLSHGHASSEGGNSPLSKSTSSSFHKLHHLSASSNDRLSNKIPLANQFTIEEEQDQNKQDSQLLLNDKKPCFGLLNPEEDDEMKITGYRRSHLRTFLCWLCICLTGGLLRLILHWWRHWYLIATHEICSLEEAEKVLVQEDYKGKHKVFYVKQIQSLDFNTLRQDQLKRAKQLKKINNENLANGCNSIDAVASIDEKNFHLSMHFEGGQFKCCARARIFNCKQLRYAWNTQTQTFDKLQGLDVEVLNTYFH